jgi:uncharacterized protein (TIGR03067 family)
MKELGLNQLCVKKKEPFMPRIGLAGSCGVGLVVVAIVGLHVRIADGADHVDEELLEKLQGQWYPISSILDGKEKAIAREPSFVIEGRFMLIRFQDQVVGKVEIMHLVAQEALGHIDYELREPTPDTKRIKQLFKLEGDKLTTCSVVPPGPDRPSEMTSPIGSMRLLTVSERRKRESK